jgi:hypothetical protein
MVPALFMQNPFEKISVAACPVCRSCSWNVIVIESGHEHEHDFLHDHSFSLDHTHDRN